MRKKYVIILLIFLIASLVLNLLLAGKVLDYYRRVLLAELYPAGSVLHNPSRGVLSSEPTITYLGDSRIAQWRLLPDITEYSNINAGVSGQTTAQLRLRIGRDILVYQSNIVVIQAGINDLKAIGVLPEREHEIIEDCVDNLITMAGDIEATGSRVVLMTIIPPYQPDLLRRMIWSDQIELAVAEVNERLKLLAGDQIILFDTSFLAEKGRVRSEYARDCLHLNEKGYQLINERLAPVLEKQLRLNQSQ